MGQRSKKDDDDDECVSIHVLIICHHCLSIIAMIRKGMQNGREGKQRNI